MEGGRLERNVRSVLEDPRGGRMGQLLLGVRM